MHAFPRDLVPLLRCERDGAALSATADVRGPAWGIAEGFLRCQACGSDVRVEGGIVRMIGSALSGEDELERAVRDAQFDVGRPRSTPAPTLADRLEVAATLRALAPRERTVLEIGSGDGRLTVPMAEMGARVLAVDFSVNSLRALADRLAGRAVAARIGLVHADANRLRLAPHGFDRSLSTTSLDTREQRMALYRTVADALDDGGRYVASVEHDDLGRRLMGLPRLRRYPSGILVEHFAAGTLRREAGPYFAKLAISSLRARVPFLSRLPRPAAAALARAAVALPLLASLGELLLLRAERPIRSPVEGARRSGSPFAQRCFRWYARRLGKEPLWENNERV